MRILEKIWKRIAGPENPWDTQLPFINKQYSNPDKSSTVYLGSHLEIRASENDKVTISKRATFIGHVMSGIGMRGVYASPHYTTKPEFLHEAPLSKAAALALLDHHFSDRNFATDEQRAIFHNWKSKLPETDMQGYRLTPRPASADAPAPSAA